MKFVIALIVAAYIALQEVAAHTPRSYALLAAFKHGDADQNGQLTTSEIPKALQHLTSLVPDFTITPEAVANYDMDDDKQLNFIEFVSALGHNKYFEGYATELQNVFITIDKATDKDNYITPEDLLTFTTTAFPKSEVTIQQIEAFIKKVEVKANMVKDQKLDYNEFVKIITGKEPAHELHQRPELAMDHRL